MGIIAPTQTKKMEFELVPNGTHIATCFSMIHIGTIEQEYMGEKKLANKVRLAFEVPAEMRNYNGVELPMSISKEYTLSMYEMANLRKDLESWRGKAFTDIEAETFDITKLLGVSCMISVMKKVSKLGNDYAVISTISPLMKGTPAPEQINQPFQFNYNDNFDTDWLDNQCTNYLREKIVSSEEYKSKKQEGIITATEEGFDHKGGEDDLPF
tara:strand:- start:1968 stop:2603 length:636 start_codon:yes stop_codon:yes gene_type:complete